MAVSDIDLKPTEAMARAAERGLNLREEHGRGGTEVGVARARDIKNRKNLSPGTVRRMHSFFSRHAVDKKGKGWDAGSEGYPSAGKIAHLLWGGDPGKSWAERKVKQLDKAQGKSESSRGSFFNPMTVQRYDPDCTMFSRAHTCLILGIAAKPAVFDLGAHEEKDIKQRYKADLKLLKEFASKLASAVSAVATTAVQTEIGEDASVNVEYWPRKAKGRGYENVGMVSLHIQGPGWRPVSGAKDGDIVCTMMPPGFRDRRGGAGKSAPANSVREVALKVKQSLEKAKP